MSPIISVFNYPRRLLHWLIAGLVAVQVPLAWTMIDQPLGPDKVANYGLHKSMGILLFGLGAVRVITALLTNRPELPSSMPGILRIISRVNELVLFIIVLLMPLTGWLMSSAANFPVNFFGLFTLPDIVEPDKQLFQSLQIAHRLQSYVLLALVTVHTLAALRHLLIVRDNVVYTMLPVKRLKNND